MLPDDDTYLTIAAPCEGVYRSKGSRFLAYAFPVANEDEVRQHVAWAKKEHFGARHHCYAYRIGKGGASYRANDDGEPSSTAGKPILGQLLSANITNTLIVVVRYFGGTLLGTSGLIAAYKSASADALLHAQIEPRTWNVDINTTVPYAAMNELMRLVKEEALTIVRQECDSDKIQLVLRVRESKAAKVRHLLQMKNEGS